MTAVPPHGLHPPVGDPPPGLVHFQTSGEMNPAQRGDVLANVRHNMKWVAEHGVPVMGWDSPRDNGGRSLLIVGGGPSLRDTEPELRAMARDHDVIAVNDAHDWLMERGIVPTMFAMMEIDPWPSEFVRHANDTTEYYLSSFAHPSAYERLLGRKLTMFLSLAGAGEESITCETHAGWPIVSGGEAMAIRAINLGYFLGYRDFHMFGVDGCYRDDAPTTHVYLDRKRTPTKITCAGRTFTAPYYLARQANDLRSLLLNLGHCFTLTTHGDGLVQHMHRTLAPERYAA